jgi:hypothetical protein
MNQVLNLMLTHQSPKQIAGVVNYWRDYCAPENLLIIFTGNEADYDLIQHPTKVRVDDPRLRTRRHVEERQSYCGVFQAASDWLRGRSYTHVFFAEYDHLPLRSDLNERQLARLAEESADVLGVAVGRVDGTNWPHYLYHSDMQGFSEYWARMSVRTDKTTVLHMFCSGSFWTRQAFDAVAQTEDPFPIYLEIFIPTAAHHLGFRVRDWGEEASRFINNSGNFMDRMEEARRAGAWTIHPVKTLPSLP